MRSTGKTRRRRRTNRRFEFLAGQTQRLWRLWPQVDWRRLRRHVSSRRLFAFRRDFHLLEGIRAASPALRVRAGVFVVLGLVLTWQVIHAFLAFQSQATAEGALNLDPADLAVVSGQADQFLKLGAARIGQADESRKNEIERSPLEHDPEKLADFSDKIMRPKKEKESAIESTKNNRALDRRQEIREQAEQVLRRNPLNGAALQVLGQLAEAAKNEASAVTFFQAAARRSLRESYAVYRLMQKSFNDQDYAMTAHYADALLRNRPQLVEQAVPILARMAEDKDGSVELTKLLVANPPWRSSFLSMLPRGITDARTPLNFLLALRETPNPPTTADLGSYISFLIGHKLYEIAYYSWLQFLPHEQLETVGFLFNGGFENPSSGLPFDWKFTRGSGVTIDFAPRPDDVGQRALFIRFGYGRVEFHGVSQFTMLAPGTYRLEGRYKGDLSGRRGLTWRISCAEGTRVGQSTMVTGMTPAWKEFNFTFTVPPKDCRAQRVRLVLDARSASERLVSGSIWYDDLRILPAEPDARRSALTRRSPVRR